MSMNGEYYLIVSNMLIRVTGMNLNSKQVFDTSDAAIEAAKDIIDELVKGEHAVDPNISPSTLANRFIYFDYMPFIFGPDGQLPWFDCRRYAEARCYEVCEEVMPAESFYGGMMVPTGRGTRGDRK